MKVSLLASVFAALAMNGSILVSANADKLPARDTRVIVELDAGLDGYTKSGVERIQDSFLASVRSNVTENFKVIKRYSVLNNAVALSVNSAVVAKLEKMPGVASVTKDTIHWKRAVNNDETISVDAAAPAGTEEENISFVSTDSLVFHEGIDQPSWNSIIQVSAPSKYEAVQQNVAK